MQIAFVQLRPAAAYVIVTSVMVACGAFCGILQAQESQQHTDSKGQSVVRPNLKTKTLGGKQFWSDVFWLSDWRIQRNAVTKHHRLLDPLNQRRAWGTYDECTEVFAKLRVEIANPLKQSVVVVLHGLGRSPSSMANVAAHLAKEEDWNVANIAYASGRSSIDEHANHLAQILEVLRNEGVTEIHFVAHSLGNLVVRRYFGLFGNQATADQKKQPTFKRMVMLAPPNQGSRLAEFLKKNPAFRILTGKSGQQIAEIKVSETDYPPPTCEFAIIAGGKGRAAGRNPLLAGDDDLVVSVEETKLVGAADFLVVPAVHTFIMNDLLVHAATMRFLKNGFFVSEEERNPL